MRARLGEIARRVGLQLRGLPGRVRTSAPVAVVLALVVTAATGASAVSARLSSGSSHPAAAPAARPHAAVASAAVDGSGRPGRPAVRPAHYVIPRPRHLVDATLLVTNRTSLTGHQLRAIRALDGVRALQTVAAGSARVDGHRAFVLGVNPARFRPWTPKLTAASDPLWQSVARGELTASFDMGHEARLPLGATVPVRARHGNPMRIGAFASVGMSGVDAVVSGAQAASIGLQPRTGVVIAAPHADPAALRHDVAAIVGAHAHAWLLREIIVVRDAGEFLTRVQINTVLQAAASRVGKPYVWGATGPDTFDCSGLVLWSFAHAGIRMPRVSQQQWFAGPHINYSDARPGDLLFWHYDPTDPANIDHVAIYAGNGMMLVAPHTGAYVEYVPVPLTNLAGVVRVDPAMAAQI